MSNTINLIVGDWSHDGHNQTDTVTIKSNKTAKQIEAAYKKGTKKVGVDLVATCCEAYEERHLKKNAIEKFKKVGIDTSMFDNDEYGSAEDWAVLYIDICKLGDPTLKVDFVMDFTNEIHIGGYGLYFS